LDHKWQFSTKAMLLVSSEIGEVAAPREWVP
jgi:hypothetical protein